MSLQVLEVDQGTEAWHDARRGVLTASTIGRLLTPTLKVADNDTSRALIATLATERITGWTEDTPMTADMWRGVEHEPYARDVYSAHYQQAVECGFMVQEGDGWTLGYSPDGLVGTDGLIEIKCPRSRTHLNTILAGEVPAYYMAQIQCGLLVSERDWCDFVSYVSGMPLFVKRVKPDAEWFVALIDAAVEAERRIEQIVADYRTKTTNLPATERINTNIVELTL